jgi:hypothetical protein
MADSLAKVPGAAKMPLPERLSQPSHTEAAARAGHAAHSAGFWQHTSNDSSTPATQMLL